MQCQQHWNHPVAWIGYNSQLVCLQSSSATLPGYDALVCLSIKDRHPMQAPFAALPALLQHIRLPNKLKIYVWVGEIFQQADDYIA